MVALAWRNGKSRMLALYPSLLNSVISVNFCQTVEFPGPHNQQNMVISKQYSQKVIVKHWSKANASGKFSKTIILFTQITKKM